MKQLNKLISSFLAVIFTISTAIPLSALAAKSFSDVKGHWAETYISSAVNRGYVNGYQNGTFQPNHPVTRAEFCKMMNSALSVSGTTTVDFKDVSSGNWYYNEVRKALAAGYISGYDDNSFRANELITRQEAAVIIARIVAASNDSKNLSEMNDNTTIDAWAMDGARTVYSKGYMSGDNKKKFNPKGNLTRAEAVKIIESVMKKETLTSSNISITSPNQLDANTIYTGNITVRIDSNSDATFQNCRILGTLQVSGGDTIRLENTKVNNLVVNNTSGEVEILSSGTSEIHNTTVSGACSLNENNSNGTGFEKVNLSGSDLKNRKVNLTGDFPSVSLSNPSNLSLLSGSIGQLTLASNGKGSRIDLASRTTVNKLEISGASDFVGKGTINKAILHVSGSTFETAPLSIEGKTAMVPSLYPANGATNVSVTDSIRITFNDTLYTSSGSTPSSSYIEDSVVELRKSATNGTKVPFSTSLNSNRKEITIRPVNSLEKGTKYYVIVKSALSSSDGYRNDPLTFSFSTVGGLTPEVYPVSGSDAIPVTAKITLTFDQAIYQKNGGTISSSYLTDSVLGLRRDSSSGTQVPFAASLSSDRKTITLTPKSNLSTSTRYYVILQDNSLTNTDNISNAGQTYTFTTANTSTLVPVINPASGSSAVRTSTDLVLTFDSPVYTASGSTVTSSYLRDAVFTLRSGSTSGSSLSFTGSINSARTVLTLTPDYTLSTNTTYYLTMQASSLADGTGSSRKYNERQIFSFTTGSGKKATLEPSPYPASGTTNVVTNNITLTFDESIYQSNSTRSDISSSYLQNNVLEVRKGSVTGDYVAFSAWIDGNRRYVTITPSLEFSSDTRYYVIVKDGSIQNFSGDRNQRFTTYFTTSTNSRVLTASISPANGSNGVSSRPSISLNFEEALYDRNGNSLTNSDPSKTYLKNNAIELRSGSDSGTKVPFTINSFSNNRWISLTPDSPLADRTTYYLVIPEGTLKIGNGVYNKRQVYHFTVGSVLELQVTPRNGTQHVDKATRITLSLNDQVYTSSYVALTNSNIASYMSSIATLRSSNGYVSFGASISNGKEITLYPNSPLDANTLYTLTIPENKLSNSTGSKNYAFSSSFTTVTAPTIPTPTVSCSDVAVDGKQTISLNFGVAVQSSANLAEKIVLHKDTSSGATVSCSTALSGNTITLNPETPLLPDTTYYVTAEQGFLTDNAGNKNQAFALNFKTKAPQISIRTENVDKTSANIVVDYDYPGVFTVTATDGKTFNQTPVINLSPTNSTGSFSRLLTGLSEGTQYTITVTYKYAGSSTIEKSCVFTTNVTSNNSSLASLQAKDDTGTQEVPLTDPANCTVQVNAISKKATIIPTAADTKSTIVVAGATPVAGSSSYEVDFSTSATATVTITVTAEDLTFTEYKLTLTLQ